MLRLTETGSSFYNFFFLRDVQVLVVKLKKQKPRSFLYYYCRAGKKGWRGWAEQIGIPICIPEVLHRKRKVLLGPALFYFLVALYSKQIVIGSQPPI